MNEDLKKLENFFTSNLKIKQLLVDAAPMGTGIETEDKIKYLDKLNEILDRIQTEFEKIQSSYPIDAMNVLTNLFKEYKDHILNFNYTSGSVRELYNQNFANMDEKLVEEVNTTLIGYNIFSNPQNLLTKCKTINELLHVYHSFICNNERIYQSMPRISQKQHEKFDSVINLYGMDNPLARNIFENFPEDLDAGDTDIVALNNRILMMVRDLGHALSIELTETTDNEIEVHYFIPKICNANMVNQLRGVRKITPESKFAKGFFVSKRDNILNDVFEFIDGVPSDLDREEITTENTESQFEIQEKQEELKSAEIEEDNDNKENKLIQLPTDYSHKNSIMNLFRKAYQKFKQFIHNNDTNNNINKLAQNQTTVAAHKEFADRIVVEGIQDKPIKIENQSNERDDNIR